MERMRRRLALATAVSLLATMLASPVFAQETLAVRLVEQNGSGVSGTATLTDLGGGRTRVEVRVAPGGNDNMPAHIHEGACPQPGAVRYPLANVQNGTSTTEVAAALQDLLASPMAINLHKSPQEVSVYTACGNLVAASTAARPAAAGGPAGLTLAAVLAAVGAGLVGVGAWLRRR